MDKVVVVVVVVVVVRVKGAIKVIDLGGAVLYISSGPVAQLTPLRWVCVGGWVEIAPGRG